MSLDSLREELIDLGEGLPFELVVGDLIEVPDLDDWWDGVDEIIFGTNSFKALAAIVIKYKKAFTVGWKWLHEGKHYGSFLFTYGDNEAEVILGELTENFKLSSEAIKAGGF